MDLTQKIILTLGVLIFLIYYKYIRKEKSDLSFALLLVLASMILSKLSWEIFGRTIRLGQIASIIIFIHLVIIFKKNRSIYLDKYSYLILSILPFLFISSILISPSPAFSGMKSLLYLPYFAGYIAVTNELRSESMLGKAWDFFYKFSAVIITLSVISFFLFQVGVNLGTVRNELGSLWLQGPVLGANIFGSTAVIIFVIAFVKLFFKTEQTMRFDILALSSSSAGIILSLTRAAWGGAVLSIFLILVFSLFIKKTKAMIKPLLITVGTIAFVLIITLAIMPAITEHVDQDISLIREDVHEVKNNVPSKNIQFQTKTSDFFREVRSGGWRRKVFLLALKEWLANPIFGNGTESLIYKHDDTRMYIASTFIAVLHDWGIIALILLLIFYILVFTGLARIAFFKTKAPLHQIAFSQLIILIVSTLMYQLSTPMWSPIYWILLAIFACTVSIHSKQSG